MTDFRLHIDRERLLEWVAAGLLRYDHHDKVFELTEKGKQQLLPQPLFLEEKAA